MSAQTPAILQRTKQLDNTEERIDSTKLSTITASPNLVSSKADLITHKLQPVRSRRHKTSNGLQKISTKIEAISQYPLKLTTRRNFLNINIPGGLQDSITSISPNTRQPTQDLQKSEPFSPWHRDSPAPSFDVMKSNGKPSKIPLKNVEEHRGDFSDHGSSLRMYLNKDKDK